MTETTIHEGGSYRIDLKTGAATLVERTDWEPPAETSRGAVAQGKARSTAPSAAPREPNPEEAI